MLFSNVQSICDLFAFLTILFILLICFVDEIRERRRAESVDVE